MPHEVRSPVIEGHRSKKNRRKKKRIHCPRWRIVLHSNSTYRIAEHRQDTRLGGEIATSLHGRAYVLTMITFATMEVLIGA